MAILLNTPISHEDHIQGYREAPITLVEYGHYQCQSCKEAYPIVKKIEAHFGTKLRFIYRHFTANDPIAKMAAECAEFANQFDQFWKMHELLFTTNEPLNKAVLIEFAKKLNLPITDLEIALENKTYQSIIERNDTSGVDSGVSKTPTFFINNLRYNGSINYEGLLSTIATLAID